MKEGAISQEEYDDAVQANLGAQAAVIAAKAQVEQAEVNLGFTRITSPIDGVASIAPDKSAILSALAAVT